MWASPGGRSGRRSQAAGPHRFPCGRPAPHPRGQPAPRFLAASHKSVLLIVTVTHRQEPGGRHLTAEPSPGHPEAPGSARVTCPRPAAEAPWLAAQPAACSLPGLARRPAESRARLLPAHVGPGAVPGGRAARQAARAADREKTVSLTEDLT